MLSLLSQTGFQDSIKGPITGAASDVSFIEKVLSATIGLMTIIGGIIFVTFIIIAAYNWMTAEGKPENVEKARNHIVNAVTGLLILIGAYALSAVLANVLGLDIFNLSAMVDSLQGF